MATAQGVSKNTINRLWQQHNLKPHLHRSFKLSRDPRFLEKLTDVVGLYLNPPQKAVVICVDEKSQIQALNRTQPILPLRPGQVERYTPEYQRNGTTSLFAALDVATGNVIGRCFRRHRTAEFRRFLNHVDEQVPAELEVHLILDNYATHKTAIIRQWLLCHPRYHLHFTPTHSSWINQVERWFALLSQRQIKRGSHHNVRDLELAIEQFVAAHNENPKPFVWTKNAGQILESLRRYAAETMRIQAD